MLSPSDYNSAVPQFTNGNYAANPINPLYIEEPTSTDYNRGVEPLQTLPAQWWNWLANQFTSRFNKLNIYVKNIFNELAQLLSLVNITPDGTEGSPTVGQLKTMFQTNYPQYIALLMYPVGSIYWTSKAPNDGGDPNVLFGGTWVRIKDRFVLAAGDTYANGATGGEASVTLTTTTMPSHTHTFSGNYVTTETYSANTGSTAPGFSGISVDTSLSSSSTTGGESAHTHSIGAHSHPMPHTHTMSHTHTAGTLDLTGSLSPIATMRGSTNNDFTHTGVFSTSKHSGTFGNANGSSQQQRITVNFSASGNWTGSTSEPSSANTGGVSTANTSNSTAFTSGAGTSHYHSMQHYHTVKAAGTVESHSHSMTHSHGVTATGTNSSTGSGGAHNNMPPYVVKYCWERTA